MNEDRAREVTLLQAFETVQPPTPNWTEDDRAWATRLALEDGAADTETFITRRARHALQRLAPREPAAAKWLARRLWQQRWIAWAALAGLIVGLLVDSIGSGQRINLLAPPLWAVLVWNALVYLLLLGHALARLLMRPTRPGGALRLMQRVLRFGRGLPAPANADSAGALAIFGTLWLRRSAPLSIARAATLLHVAAAALALGLVAGMYLRGLVFDYRATWESTFLTADAAHAILATVLAPAITISGIALPDAATFELLRGVHGDTAPGAPAAAWIHLLALTLLLFVVLPRTLLALVDALRARWLAGHVALPLGDAYFHRLERQQRGDVAQVVVLPYASTPSAQAALALRALLAPALGDGLQIRIAPTMAFGAEDEVAADLPPGTTLAVALFDLAATPEAENQGRFAQQLAARLPIGAGAIVLVDEAAFGRRFGADSARLAQRRDSWRVFAETLGTLPVFVDLDGTDPGAATRAIELALRSPVRGAAQSGI